MISREELDEDKQPVWTEPSFRKKQRFAWVKQWKSNGPVLCVAFVIFSLFLLILLGALK